MVVRLQRCRVTYGRLSDERSRSCLGCEENVRFVLLMFGEGGGSEKR